MKFRLNQTIVAGALGLGLGLSASAQSSLVAAWDFSQYSSPGGYSSTDAQTLVGSLDSNWSGFHADDGTGFLHRGPNYVGAAQFGTLYYDGQFGSSVYGLNPSDLLPSGNVNMSVGDLVDGVSYNANGNLGVLGDQGQQYANKFSLGFKAEAEGKSFVFGASLNANSAFQQGSGWLFQFGGQVGLLDTDSASTINWEYSLDGTDYTSVATSNLTQTETLFTVDLSEISELEGASDVFMRGTFTGLDGLSYIDNVSFLASPVPEPSAYAAIFGFFALGFVAFRRRVNK